MRFRKELSSLAEVSLYIKSNVLLLAFPYTRSFNVPKAFGLQGSPHTIGPTNCTDVTQPWLEISRQVTATSYRQLANQVHKYLLWQATPDKWQCLLKKSSSNRVSGSIAGSTFLSSCQKIFEVHGVHIPWNCDPSRSIMHNSGWQKGLSVKTTLGNGKCQSFLWKCQSALYEGWNFNSGNYLFTTDTK